MDFKKTYLYSVVNNKCPRCREGNIYCSSNAYKMGEFTKMNETCPVCGQPTEIEVGRYHSWVLSNDFPEEINISAETLEGEVMAFSHRKYPIVGVQFHPESILTPFGRKIIENWIKS